MRKKKRKCKSCGIDITHRHRNSLRCDACSESLRKSPRHNLTKEQQHVVRDLAGKVLRKKIVEISGATESSVKRFAKEEGINLTSYHHKDEVINEVCEYYAIHGKIETQKKFPDIKVRSIIERNPIYEPRQVRWRQDQVELLIKSAGILSKTTLAKHFNRPRANEGSITSAYQKKFKFKHKNLNGLPPYLAEWFIETETYSYKTEVMAGKKQTYKVLWVDIESNMRQDLPSHIKKGIHAMAKFQRWLHGESVHKSIEDIILL